MKYIFLLVPFLVLSKGVFSQAKVEMTIQLLDSDVIGNATLDKEPFFEWIKQTNTAIENRAKKMKGNKEIMILFSFHHDKAPTVLFSSKPALKKSKLKKLLADVDFKNGPHTKFVDYNLLLSIAINGGVSDSELEFTPTLLNPEDQRVESFKLLDSQEKVRAYKKWMNDEIIPLIASFELAVDTVFKGVLEIGDILNKKKYLENNIEELTTLNSLYWQGILEMEQWNQLSLFSKTCMYFGNGEFDKGDNTLFFVQNFSDEATLAYILASEIVGKLNLLKADRNELIEQGLALHDKGEFEAAIKHYNKVQKTFPNSAWLKYELYYSNSVLEENKDSANELWHMIKHDIYKSDPMYAIAVHAVDGKSGYLLFRRSQTQTLFKSTETIKEDLLTYADIALELENYGIAAEIYWLLYSHLNKAPEYANRNLLMYFLYSLEKLNVTSIKDNFKGDFTKEFQLIEAERERIMIESMWYKMFSKD